MNRDDVVVVVGMLWACCGTLWYDDRHGWVFGGGDMTLEVENAGDGLGVARGFEYIPCVLKLPLIVALLVEDLDASQGLDRDVA